MNDCEHTLPALEARRRGRLAAADAAGLDAHLARCEACRSLAEAARLDAVLDAPIAAEAARVAGIASTARSRSGAAPCGGTSSPW